MASVVSASPKPQSGSSQALRAVCRVALPAHPLWARRFAPLAQRRGWPVRPQGLPPPRRLSVCLFVVLCGTKAPRPNPNRHARRYAPRIDRSQRLRVGVRAVAGVYE
jgi:hypothetical protein